ncbi:unnamed protein product, partial [marine sediment metagenome]
GITTIKPIIKPPTYSRKSIDNMSRKELAIEVKKVFEETLFEFVQEIEQGEQDADKFLTDYDAYVKYRREHGEKSEGWITIPGVGKEPRWGALALFDVKADWSEEKIKAEFAKRRREQPEPKPSNEFKKITQDLQIYTDKKLESVHGDFGWTVSIIDKPKDSNVLLTLVYDGGAYDYFSYEADYGEGMISKRLDKKLEERFGKNVMREDFISWASEIYDVR